LNAVVHRIQVNIAALKPLTHGDVEKWRTWPDPLALPPSLNTDYDEQARGGGGVGGEKQREEICKKQAPKALCKRDQTRRSLAADTGCIQNATAAVSQGPSATAASQQAQAAVPTLATRAATARNAAAAAARGHTGGLGAEFAWAARYHGFHVLFYFVFVFRFPEIKS